MGLYYPIYIGDYDKTGNPYKPLGIMDVRVSRNGGAPSHRWMMTWGYPHDETETSIWTEHLMLCEDLPKYPDIYQ